MTGDRALRVAMWVLATGVAAIAAVVSYNHIYDIARGHGGTVLAARLLPLSVDMLIVVGELMLLHEDDAAGRRFPLGWVLVCSGIGATLFANVTYGAQFGVLGAVLWGWPAYSFILVAAGMVAIAKRGAQPQPAAQAGHGVPRDALDAAIVAMAATAQAGNPLSGRQLDARFGVGRNVAARVRTQVLASMNGHGAPEVPAEQDE